MVKDETLIRVRGIRFPRGKGAIRLPRGNQAARRRIPKAGRTESAKTWAETKGQTTLFLGPRGNRDSDGFRLFFSHLTCQFGIRQALADDLPNQIAETVSIAHRQTIVVPER